MRLVPVGVAEHLKSGASLHNFLNSIASAPLVALLEVSLETSHESILIPGGIRGAVKLCQCSSREVCIHLRRLTLSCSVSIYCKDVTLPAARRLKFWNAIFPRNTRLSTLHANVFFLHHL
jgi:hypothetical protein